jgi:hypothetical protein
MSHVDTPPQGLVLGSKLYDQLRFVSAILLPALATLVITFGQIFEFEGPTLKAGAAITAFDFFLGSLLRKSSKTFNAIEPDPDGAFLVTKLPNGKTNVELEFEQHPDSLINGRKLTFKVKETEPEFPEQVPEEDRE